MRTCLALCLLVLGCSTPRPPGPSAADKAQRAAKIGLWGFDTQGQDLSVSPGDDFDAFANGAWKEKFEIPPDRSSYGVFVDLNQKSESDIHDIVEELPHASDVANDQDSIESKVGRAYSAWMNIERIDQRGLDPIKEILREINAITELAEVTERFASIHQPGPFEIGIIPDPADTTRYIAYFGQSGLGLPDRDYYLNEDARFEHYREKYKDFIKKILTLSGIESAQQSAQNIMEFETALAKVHWTKAASRDIEKIYNPMSLAQLAETAPEFRLKKSINMLGLSSVSTFVVAQPSAIRAMGKILAETPLETLKSYLAFHAVRAAASYLPSTFDQANFDFYSKTLKGIPQQRARWKRGVSLINRSMGEAVGQLYVRRHFPESAKIEMESLVKDLRESLESHIRSNSWMDDETKKEALKKLSTFEARIGYPSKWTDYTSLKIGPDAFENARSVASFNWQRQLKELKGPVDREKWPYPPQTINASYNPFLNQITFPAGILQPPFFDPLADAAANYGAIGAVIGHEIGHGFDDQGRRFDEKGQIRDWWSPNADQAYKELSARLGKQFSTYEPVKGLRLNAELTMGENIGDLGGLQMAYAAYHRHLLACCDGKAKKIDGTTGDQRFFLSWAQVWRAKFREDEARQRVLTDPHSPPRFRINGIVRNMDPWYNAFNVDPTHALFLPKNRRIAIW